MSSTSLPNSNMSPLAVTASSTGFVSQDIDETRAHMCAMLGRRFDIEPLGKARFEARLMSRSVGPLSIVSAEYLHGLQCHAGALLDTVSVSIVKRGGSTTESRTAAVELGVGDACIYNTASVVSATFQTGFEHCFLTFTKAEVEALSQKLFERHIVLPSDIGLVRLRDPTELRSIATLAAVIEETVSANVDRVDPSPALGLLRDATLMRIVEAVPVYREWLNARPGRPASWQIRRALDFIAAQSQPVGVNQVAEVAGIGVRALQIAFQEQLGMTPHSYLKRMRLEAVRAALSAPDTSGTVGETARFWGFSNMTRFAAEYEQAFGSKPSRRNRDR